MLERDRFPRFRIGESLLPETLNLMRELQVDGLLERIAHVPKFGGVFGMGGGDEVTEFIFGVDPQGRPSETFNVERAVFDEALLAEAQAAGATVRFDAQVRSIDQLEAGGVSLTTSVGPVRGRVVLDASGGACVVGRHLGIMRHTTDARLKKVAYFEHYRGVDRPTGPHAGSPMVVMCDEGWFWLIPLNDEMTSVGLVLDADAARRIDVPAGDMLAWGIERCPLVRHRMRRATGPATNRVAADFTYSCSPAAGPGYFLLGDAAHFLDPVFSTGVHLGMLSGRHAGELVVSMQQGAITPVDAHRQYMRRLRQESRAFFQIIDMFYDPAFRDLFLHGRGPFGMHKALVRILAGHASGAMPWSTRWRYELFRNCVKLHRAWPLVVRRPRHALCGEPSAGRGFE